MNGQFLECDFIVKQLFEVENKHTKNISFYLNFSPRYKKIDKLMRASKKGSFVPSFSAAYLGHGRGGITLSRETQRLLSRSLPPTRQGGHQVIPKTANRYDLFSISWVCLRVSLTDGCV